MRTNKYRDVIKKFLAGIKITWQLKPTLWRHMVLRSIFWGNVGADLTEVCGWSEQDEAAAKEAAARFTAETAGLPFKLKVERLEALLCDEWTAMVERAVHATSARVATQLYRATIKIFLTGIRTAWHLDETLWQRVVIRPSFWQRVSQNLEQACAWSAYDDRMVELLLKRFSAETSSLGLDEQVARLGQLLRQGFASAVKRTSRQLVSDLRKTVTQIETDLRRNQATE